MQRIDENRNYRPPSSLSDYIMKNLRDWIDSAVVAKVHLRENDNYKIMVDMNMKNEKAQAEITIIDKDTGTIMPSS